MNASAATLAASSAKAPLAVTLRSRSQTCAWIAASVRHAAAMTNSAAVNQPIVPLAWRAGQDDPDPAPGVRDYAAGLQAVAKRPRSGPLLDAGDDHESFGQRLVAER